MLQDIINLVKSVDFKEVFLFVVTMSMIILLIVLFHYSSIQTYVKNNSRCVKEKTKGRKQGSYVVNALNENNEPLYKVTYNPSAKQYQLDCACEKGSVVNQFSGIKVYDMRDSQNPVKNIDNQTCYCDKFVEPRQNTYYTGYPDLIRFMNYGDTAFFTSQ